jgi:hypothetical protein
MGSPVVTFLTCESSLQTRQGFDATYAQSYPNATQLITYDGFSSTRKFNCHGYAWLRVEQGIDRWIGTGRLDLGDIEDPEMIYMTDGSYTQVSQETYPGKVFWGSNDHSAVTTNQTGVFISKWNEYPLMQHAWNYSPYGTNNLKYYKRTPPSISGPSCFNTSATFTINNLPSGATITTSVSYGLTATRSGDTISVLNSTGNADEGWLSVNILINGQTISLTKLFIYGEYTPSALLYRYVPCSSSGWSENNDCYSYDWCDGPGNKFRLNLFDEAYRDLMSHLYYQARVVRRSDNTVIWSSPSSFSGYGEIDVEYYGSVGVVYDLEIRLITYNPNSQWEAVGEFNNHYCSSNGGGGGTIEEMAIYPNPNTGIFTLKKEEISIDTKATADQTLSSARRSEPEELILRIYSFPKAILEKELSVTLLSGECTINTGGLPQGTYVIQIIRAKDKSLLKPLQMIVE